MKETKNKVSTKTLYEYIVRRLETFDCGGGRLLDPPPGAPHVVLRFMPCTRRCRPSPADPDGLLFFAGSCGPDAPDRLVPLRRKPSLSAVTAVLSSPLVELGVPAADLPGLLKQAADEELWSAATNIRQHVLVIVKRVTVEIDMTTRSSEAKAKAQGKGRSREGVLCRVEKPLRGKECAICLERLRVGSLRLPCYHIFHQKCIRGILSNSGGSRKTFPCPLCRAPVDIDRDIPRRN